MLFNAVELGVETVGYELLAGATLTTAAAMAGMGAGHHVAGSAFDTAGANTVGSGFHQAGDALYAVARKNFALAGEAARSALDSLVGPPRTQVDVVGFAPTEAAGATTFGLARSARRHHRITAIPNDPRSRYFEYLRASRRRAGTKPHPRCALGCASSVFTRGRPVTLVNALGAGESLYSWANPAW